MARSFALILIKENFLFGIKGLYLWDESYLQNCPQLLWRDGPAVAASAALILDSFEFMLLVGPAIPVALPAFLSYYGCCSDATRNCGQFQENRKLPQGNFGMLQYIISRAGVPPCPSDRRYVYPKVFFTCKQGTVWKIAIGSQAHAREMLTLLTS